MIYNQPCTGRFEAIHGIPCYHTLRELRARKVTVTKYHFHRHWHFERDASIPLPLPPAPPASPVIFEPYKVVTRGRRRKDRSTRREWSQFELTSGPPAHPERPGRVGGKVSQVGKACFAQRTS